MKYTHLTDNLKKIWLTLRQVKKIRETIDDIYYWLCNFWLYGDIYYRLQNIHNTIDNLIDDEYIEEDELDDLDCFIQNHCQYYL
jgi:hypothetical protein